MNVLVSDSTGSSRKPLNPSQPFAIGPLHKHLVASWPPVLAMPVLLAGSVGVGWMAHRYLERPLLTRCKTWLGLRPAAA